MSTKVDDNERRAVAAHRVFEQGTGAQETFDRLVSLAARALKAPMAEVTLILQDRQVSLSATGPSDYWSRGREVPLQFSLCRHVVRDRKPLAIEDTIGHPLVEDWPAEAKGDVRSYVSIPLALSNDLVVGALCVLDVEPRAWSPEEIALLEGLGRFVVDEMDRRVTVEERFQALIANSADVIVVLDYDGVVTYQSPSLEPILGFGEDSLLGRDGFELIHPDEVRRVRRGFLEVRDKKGRTFSTEYRHRHGDGSWRLMQVEGRNSLGNPSIQGVVLNARDITQRRAIERELEGTRRLEALGQMAGGIAHDFNNLITAMKGSASMVLDRTDLDPPVRSEIGELSGTLDRAARLTKELLTFGGSRPLEETVLDLSAAVRGCESLLERLARHDGPRIRLALDLQEGLWVPLSPSDVEQIVTNLTVNARDALPSGGRILISAASATDGDGAGETVCLSVEDDGEGISDEARTHVFEPFYTTKRPGKGTGLGLPTVWGIVQRAGGTVSLTSRPGEGTRFEIRLPRVARRPKDDGAPAERPAEAARPADDRAGGGNVVLVVDDDPSVRSVTERVLRRAGYTVLAASGAEEALRLFEERDPPVDAVVTDLTMPGMSGGKLAEALLARQADLPLIFLSGYTVEALAPAVLRRPQTLFLEKPFEPPTLVAMVAELVGAPR